MNELDIGSGIMSRPNRSYTWNPASGRYAKAPDANPDAPEYTGSIDLQLPGFPNAITLRLAAWVRRAKTDGHPFLSIRAAYSREDARRLAIIGAPAEDPAQAKAPAQDQEETIDDLPF